MYFVQDTALRNVRQNEIFHTASRVKIPLVNFTVKRRKAMEKLCVLLFVTKCFGLIKFSHSFVANESQKMACDCCIRSFCRSCVTEQNKTKETEAENNAFSCDFCRCFDFPRIGDYVLATYKSRQKPPFFPFLPEITI